MSAVNTLQVGARFERSVTFDVASIRHFAELSGDFNPLHHDAAAAARGPFGTIIVSGPHLTSLMLGLDATYFARDREALGLGFEFRFVRAVPAGTTLILEWTIASIEPKPSLRGDIVAVEGRAFDGAGIVYLTGHGTNLVRGARKAA